MGKNHAKFLAREAHRRVLTDGQGARKKKRHGPRTRSLGQKRHKRAFRDLTRQRWA
jgi:hypothetical protein